MRAFPEVFDYYQAALYDRNLLAASIGSVAAWLDSGSLLDCACGTGLPALDLRAAGIDVECSDADPAMLDQFRVNAAALGTDDKAHHLAWPELGSLGRQFDLVMCRGNSIVYADSWDRAAPAASLATVEAHLRAIASVVAPGGHLLIDAPRDRREVAASYPPATFRGERVLVSEQVRLADGCRAWMQQVVIGGAEYRFTRYSADLTGTDLRDMLHRCGFASVTDVTLDGERPSYQSLLAGTSA